MDSKPFSLQSPEHIAKEYGGNKQKIASAASMGLIDPTSAVMAGMFIDRMRSAQIQEQGAPQTVAEQVFAPPAPAAPPQGGGLAALAPAAGGAPAPPPAPPMGAPPMGGPPMGAPAAPAPPPVMAAEGGLMALPVPDAMFDEPDNGGYAGGGIVAFATGDEVDEEEGQDGLAGGGEDYLAFMERQRLEKEAKEAKNKRDNKERRDASLKGEAKPLRPETPADGGIGPKFFARAPDARPDGEGKELVARGQEWGDKLRASAAPKPKPKAPPEPGYGKVAPSGAAQIVSALRGINEKNEAYSARNNAEARKAKGLPPVEPAGTKAPPAVAQNASQAPTASVPRTPVQAPAPARGLAAAAQASVPRAPRGVSAAAPRGLGATGATGVGAPGSPPSGAPQGDGSSYYGMSTDPLEQAKQLRAMANIDNSDAKALKDYYAKSTSPEAMAAQKKQDLWSSLAQIGFGMAGTNSPSFMQAAGQSASAAMPGMMQAAKERKAAERDAMKARYDIQKGENQEGLAIASAARSGAVEAGKGIDSNKWNSVDAQLKREGMALQERLAVMQENGANGRAMMSIAAANARENNISPKDIASMRLKAYEVANDYIKANAGNPRAAKQDLDAVAAQVFANMSGGFKPPAPTAPTTAGNRKPLNSILG